MSNINKQLMVAELLETSPTLKMFYDSYYENKDEFESLETGVDYFEHIYGPVNGQTLIYDYFDGVPLENFFNIMGEMQEFAMDLQFAKLMVFNKLFADYIHFGSFGYNFKYKLMSNLLNILNTINVTEDQGE